MTGKKEAITLFSLMTGFIAYSWLEGVDLSPSLFPYLIGAGIFSLSKLPLALRLYMKAISAFGIKISVFSKKQYVWNLIVFTLAYTVGLALLTHDLSVLTNTDTFITQLINTSTFIAIGMVSLFTTNFIIENMQPRGSNYNYLLVGVIATLAVVGIMFLLNGMIGHSGNWITNNRFFVSRVI